MGFAQRRRPLGRAQRLLEARTLALRNLRERNGRQLLALGGNRLHVDLRLAARTGQVCFERGQDESRVLAPGRQVNRAFAPVAIAREEVVERGHKRSSGRVAQRPQARHQSARRVGHEHFEHVR